MALLRGTPRHALLSPRSLGCGHELARSRPCSGRLARGRPEPQPREQSKASREQKWGQQLSARTGGPALRGVAGAGLCLSRPHRRPLMVEVSLSESRTGQAADPGGAKLAGGSMSCEVSLPAPCPAAGFQGHALSVPSCLWQPVCLPGRRANTSRTLPGRRQHCWGCVCQKRRKRCC